LSSFMIIWHIIFNRLSCNDTSKTLSTIAL
jgi:hypothetical protein